MIMLRGFLSVGLVLFVFVLMADDSDIRKNYPVAVLSADTIDMGTVQAGERFTGQIAITNEGKHNLLIVRVRSSCGLMIPNWPTDPIKQGEEVTINFRYNTNRPGPFNRNIIIHTNGYRKTLVVPVYGEVLP